MEHSNQLPATVDLERQLSAENFYANDRDKAANEGQESDRNGNAGGLKNAQHRYDRTGFCFENNGSLPRQNASVLLPAGPSLTLASAEASAAHRFVVHIAHGLSNANGSEARIGGQVRGAHTNQGRISSAMVCLDAQKQLLGPIKTASEPGHARVNDPQLSMPQNHVTHSSTRPISIRIMPGLRR